jgi:hypothetical protein
MEDKLEKYGNIYQTMLNEGDGYYFYGYESAKTFDFDEDLKTAFTAASTNLEAFKKLLEKKIIENGGNLEDWEI